MNKNKGKEIIKMIISTLTIIIIGMVLVGIISNNIILAVYYDWESSTQHSYWTNNGSTKVYEYHTSSSWSYEGNGTHWALCSKCNGAATFSCSGGSHYNGGRCTTCGGVYQTHANSGRVSYYSITATTHTPMYACTTSGCGVTYAGTAAGHTGGTSSNGGRCTVCNYQYQFAPTYTSCEIKNATKDGYDVYIYGVADQNGVNRVEFPTWTAANGQDDLVQPWPRGTDLGNGTWYYRVNASEHNNEGGTYYTHIYIYDNLGDSALATAQTVYVDKTPPTCTSAEIKNVSQTGYDVYVYGVSDANSGVSKVAFPTWTDANGQDDLIQPWPTGTNLGSGTWYYRVNISEHNNEVGKYITHIYLYDNAGNSVLGKTLETFVDTVPPNPGTITVDKQYTNQLNVTPYVVGASDNESGLRDVLICGGYGNTWISNFKGITATYDSTNNRYYANFNLAEIPNVSTGEVNQGEGTYIFNAHAYDNANNEAMTGTVEVIYDITPPSFSIDTTSCTWRNSPLSVIITAEDPISNGVNSRINETSLQYYISTSSTELLGGEWKNYASGTAFEINPQVSGTYYLFVKNVSDNAGNVGISNQGIATTIDGEIYQCFGTYQFDYEKPTIGKLYMKEGSIDGEDYINNTLTTKNVYVYVEDGTDALSGHVSTTYSINGGEAKLSGKENATELTASGIYFIVVTTIDNSGNVSTSSAYIVNINSVSLEQSSYLDYGIIKPIYKPEWTKIGSTLDIDGKTLTVELKGSAYESEEIDENVNINYSSNVTSTLSPEDIQVFIDGVEVTSSTNPTVTVNSGTTSINETSGKNEITHIVQLSNLEEAIRQTGIPYKEWSGNISLKIKGRGQGADTYTADVLVDEYGNQSMMESDENGTNVDGTWIDIKFEDTEVTQNTIGKMFADFIKPEITYVYSNLDIDYTGKTAKIVFSVTDKYFEQSTLTIDDLRILVDGEEPNWATVEEASSTDNTKPVKELTNITDVTQEINGVQKIVGKEYTITLKNLQQTPNNGYDYSGIVTVLIPQGKVSDTSGNINDAQTITVGVNIPEGGQQEGTVVDVVDPIISVTEDGLSSRNEENSIDTTEKTVTVIIQGEDKYLAQGNLLEKEYIDKIKVQIEDYNGNIIEDASAQDLKITKPDGTNIEDQTELNKYTTRVIKNITELDSTDSTIAYQIVLSNFGTFEGKVTLIIPEGAIVDTSGNKNLETPVLIGNSTYTTSFKDSMVDFIRPVWKYVNADTTRFETEGRISFTVKGVDTRLDLENSNLEVSDLKIMKDGELYLDGTNAEDATKISIRNDETNATEKSKTYTITLTGLTETGTYSLVLTKDILIDEFSNTNVGTTITFSNAELPSNTDRYNNITYHVSTNIESEHKSYVHELLTGNTTSYRPSTIGELFNNGANPLFAEPMYEMGEDGQLSKYAPKSFAGWAEADSNGNAIEGGTIYGLYDEIPNSVTHLKAMWQDATVVFVSANTGNNANSGKLPTEPVQDLQTAYNKLNSAGTAENNIIVIMDAVEWNNTETLTGNATITNLYAGIDYRTQGAELKISSDMTIKGDITFDNIKLYTDDVNNNLIVNSNSDVILNRGITTPVDQYTFGTVGGGNLEPETIRIEAGKYNSIVAGNTETTGTTAGTVHKVVIGNKRDALVGNNEKLTITSENRAIYLRALNGTTKGTVDFEMYSGKVKGNIYGGASSTETGISTVANNMAFYGGEIDGDIYGGNDDGFIENSKITLENELYSTIKFEGSIFGAGKNEKVINTSIYLTNFGTTSEPQKLISIERVENVYIGNSCIELTGRSDTSNLNPKASYTLNNIKSALTIYDNTTLYLQRGFNKVGGFNSYSELNEDNTGTKATMTNTQNKLYTLEGVNLIFAKVEGDLSDRNTEDIWGDVNGMTAFGLYTVNENGEKQYDEDLFKIGTYVEGREKENHDIAIDGFYKSFSDGSYEIIGIIDNGTNYDWILGEKVKKYEVQLIASKSEKDGTVELELDYNYLPEATYEITGISTNSLVNANNININLIDPLTVPITSQDANNTFGLTVETIESGWYSQKTATIYKDSIEGDALFEKDNSTSPGTIRFKIHNSTNITEENDLGYINLLLTGTNPNGESFDIVVAVNLKTVVEESLEVEETEKLQYIPTFTNKEEKELNYTTDSKVDITYTMYKAVTENPYSTGDYRVLSSTMKLPAGTRITINDKAKNKVYYYHVTGNETEYRLSDFIEMDSLNSYYTDSDTYYHQTDGYVLEKYDISIDFLDANISSNQLLQEIYLELRSADGTVKYDNGDTSITYSLYYNKNAIMEETINNEGQTYLVSENNEIQFTIDASLIEQETANNNIIMDTKYYDKMEGIIVEIIDEHGERVKIPENGEIKIVNANDTTENYFADSTGVIRIPIMQGLSSITKDYKMIIDEQDITSGNCTVNIYFFASDNGKHMGNEENINKQFNITFGEEQEIGIKVEATNESRVINQETRLNLEGNSGIDMKITVEKPITESNIRVELYKRDETYTDVNDESTYTGTSYTLVDLKDYLDGTWKTPEQSDSLLKSDGNYQYVIMSRKIHTSLTEIIDLKNAIKENIATGEYKLVIKLYERNTLVETLRKTFIITK